MSDDLTLEQAAQLETMKKTILMKILTKEAIDLQTKYNVVEPIKPEPIGFAELINKIIDFLKSLWNSILGR